jgi:hypothetical protein
MILLNIAHGVDISDDHIYILNVNHHVLKGIDILCKFVPRVFTDRLCYHTLSQGLGTIYRFNSVGRLLGDAEPGHQNSKSMTSVYISI